MAEFWNPTGRRRPRPRATRTRGTARTTTTRTTRRASAPGRAAPRHAPRTRQRDHAARATCATGPRRRQPQRAAPPPQQAHALAPQAAHATLISVRPRCTGGRQELRIGAKRPAGRAVKRGGEHATRQCQEDVGLRVTRRKRLPHAASRKARTGPGRCRPPFGSTRPCAWGRAHPTYFHHWDALLAASLTTRCSSSNARSMQRLPSTSFLRASAFTALHR